MLETSEDIEARANLRFFNGATQSGPLDNTAGESGRDSADSQFFGSVSSLIACLSHRFLADPESRFGGMSGFVESKGVLHADVVVTGLGKLVGGDDPECDGLANELDLRIY